MIVRMKKSSVICLLSEKENTLDSLRKLGVMHVESKDLNDSEDRTSLESQLSEATHASHILSAIKPNDSDVKDSISFSGKEVITNILELDKERAILFKDLEQLNKDELMLSPWGDFSQELIESLKGKGVFVYLCSVNKDEFEALNLDDLNYEIVNEDKFSIQFAILANEEVDEELYPLATIPTKYSLNELRNQIVEHNEKLLKIENDFINLSAKNDELQIHINELEEEIEFFANRDGMLDHGAVACISGYCPLPDVAALQAEANKEGWGLYLVDPTDDDNPPTLVTTPKIIEASKALFDFVGISPGYNEWDTSGFFLIFFTIFFSMIMGDAGYGTIFLIAAIFAKIKLGGNPKLKYALNLFLLLSVGTIFWGFITGNYFAIPTKYIPGWMQGIPWFTDVDLKDKHVQLVCFLIAAVHLSAARFWKASMVINSTKALGEIGWGLILWGNFFVARKLIVYPNSEWPMTAIVVLYGLGVLFVVIFGVNWKKMDEAFGFLFGLSGTFVDLLSYIRLFAVGLSSYYIAKSFNDMGTMIFGISDHSLAVPFLIVGMVVVILFGHILNLMLGFLGVLVHGIRLNTLEFSNHMGLQWLGHLYKPFKKK